MSQILVPEGWKSKKIFEITKSYSGGTPSTSVSEYWKDGNISWLRSGDLQDNIINKSEKFITKKGLDESSAKLWPKNTALIAITGTTTGRTAILDFESSGNQSIVGILPSKELDPKYLWYYLQFSYNYFWSKMTGGAQPHINGKVVSQREIIYPEIKIQKQIVQKLDYVISNIKEKKKSILDLKKKNSSLILGKSRGNNGTNNLSKNLYSHKLDHIFEKIILSNVKIISLPELLLEPLRNGRSSLPTKTGIPILKLSAVTFKNFNPEKFKFCNLSKKEAEPFWIKKNDILIERSNSLDYVGISAIYEGEDSAFIYPDLMIRIRANPKIILPKYFSYYLDSSKVRTYFRKNAKGTSNTMVKMAQPTIAKLEVPVPSMEIQKEIIFEIDKFQNDLNNLDEQLTMFRILQDKLLNYLKHVPHQILNEAFSGRLVN